MATRHDRHVEEVTPDVARLRIAFVNVFFAGPPRTPAAPWALIDAGLGFGAGRILEVAADRFGADARPSAIILTHGHFDHVGALRTLIDRWGVPVYAHAMELPFLTGRSDYPPPDPGIPGAMARLSPLYPRRGIDLGPHVRPLPSNGEVPGMPGWRWIHTPGHAPGHVSIFRQADTLLIAGDAVVTTRQESLLAVLSQALELNRPPKYFTIDWAAAHRSASTLASLHPQVLATGHGPVMREGVDEALLELARNFDYLAVPRHGRHVRQPVLADDNGIIVVAQPRGAAKPWPALAAVALVAAGAGILARRARRVR